MKTQISRLSPHQNGKVFGVLTALVSLLFVIPMAVIVSFVPAGVDAHGDPVSQPSALVFLFFPIIYLVMGYIMTVVGCALYNLMFKYLGGIEYESHNP